MSKGIFHANLLIGLDSAWNMTRYSIRNTYKDLGN
jgi:hypothetical protein